MGGHSTSVFYTKVMLAMNWPVQEVRGQVDHDRQLRQLLQDLACSDGRVVGSATACHTIVSWLGSATACHTIVSWLGSATACHTIVSLLGSAKACHTIVSLLGSATACHIIVSLLGSTTA